VARCKNSTCGAPYAIGNIKNAIRDYEMTHGMSADDYKIAVVVHSGGWKLVLNDEAKNKFTLMLHKFSAQDRFAASIAAFSGPCSLFHFLLRELT
jgi:hypothetical protein